MGSPLTMGRFNASRRALYVGSLQMAAIATYFYGGQYFYTDHFRLYTLKPMCVFDTDTVHILPVPQPSHYPATHATPTHDGP